MLKFIYKHNPRSEVFKGEISKSKLQLELIIFRVGGTFPSDSSLFVREPKYSFHHCADLERLNGERDQGVPIYVVRDSLNCDKRLGEPIQSSADFSDKVGIFPFFEFKLSQLYFATKKSALFNKLQFLIDFSNSHLLPKTDLFGFQPVNEVVEGNLSSLGMCLLESFLSFVFGTLGNVAFSFESYQIKGLKATQVSDDTEDLMSFQRKIICVREKFRPTF